MQSASYVLELGNIVKKEFSKLNWKCLGIFLGVIKETTTRKLCILGFTMERFLKQSKFAFNMLVILLCRF